MVHAVDGFSLQDIKPHKAQKDKRLNQRSVVFSLCGARTFVASSPREIKLASLRIPRFSRSTWPALAARPSYMVGPVDCRHRVGCCFHRECARESRSSKVQSQTDSEPA